MLSNQAGWKCDVCRKAGLEIKRRCGWNRANGDKGTAVVWARRGVALATCPKSYLTAESEALLEEYLTRRMLGGIDPEAMSARQVAAFALLEELSRRERDDGERNRRNAS
jgi:hypothetical protein